MVDPYMIASKQIQNDGLPLAFALFQSKMHVFKKLAVFANFASVALQSDQQHIVLQQNTQDFSTPSVEECMFGFLITENAIDNRLHVP
jgi:2-polyprenyl-6-methoxyphenol hydroxylase-like FAD-dependent oxidoreductase